MTSESHKVTLTRQQQRALCSFDGSVEGAQGSDMGCWEEAVRPWPTMDNLIAKGLCERTERLSWAEEEGWIYELTAEGAVEREKALDACAAGRLL